MQDEAGAVRGWRWDRSLVFAIVDAGEVPDDAEPIVQAAGKTTEHLTRDVARLEAFDQAVAVQRDGMRLEGDPRARERAVATIRKETGEPLLEDLKAEQANDQRVTATRSEYQTVIAGEPVPDEKDRYDPARGVWVTARRMTRSWLEPRIAHLRASLRESPSIGQHRNHIRHELGEYERRLHKIAKAEEGLRRFEEAEAAKPRRRRYHERIYDRNELVF